MFCVSHLSGTSQTGDTNLLLPQLLSSPQEKLNLLKTTGTDYCILLPFTHELSLLSARKFMQLLRDKFNIRILVIGYDHRFGHNRSESLKIITVMEKNSVYI